VDNFVYFSEDPATEALFERLLRERIKVDFMGLVEWFLGIHFSWRITKSAVDVHLNQSSFAAKLVEQFCRDELQYRKKWMLSDRPSLKLPVPHLGQVDIKKKMKQQLQVIN